MKKTLCLFICMTMAISVFALGNKEESSVKVRRGELIDLPIEDKDLATYQANTSIDKSGGSDVEKVDFENINTLMLALLNNKVDYIVTKDHVAQYIISKNPSFKMIEKSKKKLGFTFGTLESKKEIRDLFDEAILKLDANGKLHELIETYIENSNVETESIEMPNFAGKETILVGVTGDLPPMDYVNPDGKPSGFNAALLNEISKILEINIQLVNIESAARVLSLSSKKIDVVFWIERVLQTNNDYSKPSASDGFAFTRKYYTTSVAYVTKDFPIEEIKKIQHLD